MYHISSIKFRGFKSFKNAVAQFPTGFIALAGPNGSGKSNVADAIRFCFGEMGTKAIRVKRATELINLNSSRGEVTVVIEDDAGKGQKFEIHRTISEDGKTGYHLNGRPLTRTNVLEALRPHGLEIGHHNIIAQGQVQRIVEMKPEERRTIVDSVAGISEFDEKKKEALNELSKVDTKISEAKIVISERSAYLGELQKEKDAALSYTEAKTLLERSRATLLDIEYKKLNSQFEENLSKRKELSDKISTLQASLGELANKKADLDAKRKELAEKIGTSSKKEGLISQIQDLKVQIAQSQTLLEEKKSKSQELLSQSQELEKKQKELSHQLNVAGIQVKQKEQYLLKLQEQVQSAKKDAGISEDSDQSVSQIESVEAELSSLRQNKANLEGSISGLNRIMEQNTQMLKSATAELESLSSSGSGSSGELERISGSIDDINARLAKIFDSEKTLNKKIPELDKSLLEAKERAATLRASSSPASRNPALLTVKSLKESGTAGIYGPVSDLMSAASEYEQAAEACGGSRLNYVIVDTLDTANSIISSLKSSKSGRCSFIPLDKVIFSPKSSGVPQGAMGWMCDFVNYAPEIDNAMRYIFGDTLLVASVASAKKIGIGNYRMVTMGGELLERSGIISGGSSKTSLLSRASVQRAEDDVESIKAQRDSLYSELYSLRDEMQNLRRERAALELKLRTKEAELGPSSGKKLLTEKAREQVSSCKQSISENKSEISSSQEQIRSLESKEKILLMQISSLKEARTKRLGEQKQKEGELRKNYEKLLEQQSQFATELDSKRQEAKLLQEQLDSAATLLSANKTEGTSCQKQISQISSSLEESQKSLQALENSLKEATATVQKYYSKMQKLQEELDMLGQEEGKIKFEFDSFGRQQNELNVRHAGIETKLADLKAEWEKYSQTMLIDGESKSSLEQNIRDCEVKINALGMVNLKAPEIFEQKKAELEDMQGKIQTLEGERTAVISLIDEIEVKKKSIFNETFKDVNSHFKKLFAMVFKGEGSLVLDDPDNPLQSGLSMRVRGDNEKRDRYLESMSGGEKTLLSLMFIFSLQMKKQSPFYILDEAEAALDKANAQKMADFLRQMSRTSQFIVITHHDAILSAADVVLGVSKGKDGSKIVGVRLEEGKKMAQEPPLPETTIA